MTSIPITDEQWEELCAAVKEMTPGPWRAPTKKTGHVVNSGEPADFGYVHIAVVGGYSDAELLPFNRERWDADKALIASAPTLFREVERLREVEQRLVAALDVAANWFDETAKGEPETAHVQEARADFMRHVMAHRNKP